MSPRRASASLFTGEPMSCPETFAVSPPLPLYLPTQNVICTPISYFSERGERIHHPEHIKSEVLGHKVLVVQRCMNYVCVWVGGGREETWGLKSPLPPPPPDFQALYKDH